MVTFLGFPIEIRNICVFLAPVFSAFTSLTGYMITKEITGKSESGLFTALFLSVVPSYISRSVAGSYDNEAIAIFALVFTFYLFIKALNTGSLFWSSLASLALFYMVASWGGYSFIVNIIPIFIVGLILIGRLTTNVYITYCTFHILGSILAMQIPFVGFQAITSSEHLASHTVFVFMNVYMFCEWIKNQIGEKRFSNLKKFVILGTLNLIVIFALFAMLTGKMKWSGRSLSLLDPTYASKFIPIIASVSEHQPTSWALFFFDLHLLLVLAPIGLYFCLVEYNEGKLFLALYGVLSAYFASVMNRLLLVFAPALCILSGIGVSETIYKFVRHITNYKSWQEYVKSRKNAKAARPRYGIPIEISIILIILIGYAISNYIYHSVWATAEGYSSPSIVMSYQHNGEKIIIDDFREAYYWLRMNTKENSHIMSWWDYGYQITGMGNRTVLVDNNTWNNSHIATVGMIFGCDEEDAAFYLRKLDVNYVLVIFGGYSAYSSDDINKFLWMVRIAAGVYPEIKEEDYEADGVYRIDSQVTQKMKDSLMYKLSYYRFGGVGGYDTARRVHIGDKDFVLKHLKEVYTSLHWIVRIYEVLPEEFREFERSRSSYAELSENVLLKQNLTKIKIRPIDE
ncbi:STT3A_1 [Blepharisma stoltei]|uniref:dolichyl-diphosphooligosaccharide--protein glycotransferase n=1 Tax=Blepharisma stoltei TaxID=1481888 RepID=A0AAU9IBE3_9CILI|nr:unnamed protein product [Blepharisma stoltei]